ncbi:hypothetical protein JCGZ_16027 [Jatropha curcas]|uniref:Uncharacterized protein n=1 Tax=Jatropha curcas TaxID=180498 RepID=A0A067LAU3_JATCU|nr:hypothetical protein JCGZ_16027 [Jatropha curcas]
MQGHMDNNDVLKNGFALREMAQYGGCSSLSTTAEPMILPSDYKTIAYVSDTFNLCQGSVAAYKEAMTILIF